MFIQNILWEAWHTTAEMAPYLLFGFLIAGFLSVVLPSEFVRRHLGQRGFSSIVKATLFGIPLPLCSCSVIPVATSLLKRGASPGATIAFLLSAPQTGADSILVSYSLLGPIFAIYRPLMTCIAALLGGSLVMLALGYSPPKKDSSKITCSCSSSCSCSNESEQSISVKRALVYGFQTLPKDIGASLGLGILIAACISALVPANYFAELFSSPIVSMIAMIFCGIPLYVCATASVPVAAALLSKGVSPGAVFVFLLTGPASNAASITTIVKTMGKKVCALYLIVIVVTALSSGVLLDYVIAPEGLVLSEEATALFPPYSKSISAVLLFLVLGQSFFLGPSEDCCNEEH